MGETEIARELGMILKEEVSTDSLLSCLEMCIRDRVYTVAVSDCVYKNYNDLNYTDGKITEEDVTGLLLEELEEDSPLRIDNTPRQRVRRK